jgi:BASS family bile acid:Na+ symporter
MQKVKSYVLPIAIVLGLLLHDYCAALSVVVPFIIFTIILLTFTAVDILKLRFKPLFAWIILFQVGVSIGGYALLKVLNVNEIIAEGVLIGVLCPVAASVAVVSTMLGADRNTVTSYTVIGNLIVSLVAPVYFSFIGVNQDMPFFDSFLQILRRIGTVIGLPFFVALALQLLWPKANHFISRYKGLAFYLWAVALFLTLGQTIHFIFLNGKGNWISILWLGISALLFCSIYAGYPTRPQKSGLRTFSISSALYPSSDSLAFPLFVSFIRIAAFAAFMRSWQRCSLSSFAVSFSTAIGSSDDIAVLRSAASAFACSRSASLSSLQPLSICRPALSL